MIDFSLVDSMRDQVGPVAEAPDRHAAVARWWGHAILKPTYDVGKRFLDPQALDCVAILNESKAMERLPKITPYLGSFVNTLATLTRTNHVNALRVDYQPDEFLGDVATMAGLEPTDLPVRSRTFMDDDGITFGRLGATGVLEQIWPPVTQE